MHMVRPAAVLILRMGETVRSRREPWLVERLAVENLRGKFSTADQVPAGSIGGLRRFDGCCAADCEM
jgi:hypothetical protein